MKNMILDGERGQSGIVVPESAADGFTYLVDGQQVSRGTFCGWLVNQPHDFQENAKRMIEGDGAHEA